MSWQNNLSWLRLEPQEYREEEREREGRRERERESSESSSLAFLPAVFSLLLVSNFLKKKERANDQIIQKRGHYRNTIGKQRQVEQ